MQCDGARMDGRGGGKEGGGGGPQKQTPRKEKCLTKYQKVNVLFVQDHEGKLSRGTRVSCSKRKPRAKETNPGICRPYLYWDFYTAIRQYDYSILYLARADSPESTSFVCQPHSGSFGAKRQTSTTYA